MSTLKETKLRLNLSNNPYSSGKSRKKKNLNSELDLELDSDDYIINPVKSNKDLSSEELAAKEELKHKEENKRIKDMLDAALEEENELSKLSDEEIEKRELEIVDKRLKDFTAMLSSQNVWGHDQKGLKAIQAAMSMVSVKTGMYARIPIFCKAGNCPYNESCGLDKYGLAPEGQACPVEIAQIQKRYAEYSDEFGLDDPDNNISFTDRNLIDEIITMEIYMERCKALMSKELSPVQMTVAGVDADGKVVESPNISKAAEAYEKFSKKRNDDYRLLMATRQDKKKDQVQEKERSLMDYIQEAEAANLYDIEQRPEYIEGVD